MEVKMASTALQVNELSEILPRATPAIGRSQKCVLLIEDSEDAMLLVRFALQEHGRGKYRLEWASCLSEGLSRILQGGIDIVLLDLGLPDSSGSVSYAWIREAAPEVPVVVLTGDTREETELSVFSSGVDDYLVKEQVSGSLLVNAIQEALTKEKRRQQEKPYAKAQTHRFNWRPRG